MLLKRIAFSLILLAGSIVVPIHQSVNTAERGSKATQWADGSPMPIPTPKLADGSPMPIPAPPNGNLLADGSPMPIPAPPNAMVA
jgi:hypothetical protein